MPQTGNFIYLKKRQKNNNRLCQIQINNGLDLFSLNKSSLMIFHLHVKKIKLKINFKINDII